MVTRSRSEERFAVEVMRRVLGITVTEVDDNSRPAMVDALFVLPDGTKGALEVTTIGDRSVPWSPSHWQQKDRGESMALDGPGWSTSNPPSRCVSWPCTCPNWC